MHCRTCFREIVRYGKGGRWVDVGDDTSIYCFLQADLDNEFEWFATHKPMGELEEIVLSSQLSVSRSKEKS